MSRVVPILFNSDMVRATLDGRKTVTRRVIKPQPILNGVFWELGGAAWSAGIKTFHPMPCHSLHNRMPYQPGDVLYVRETWNYIYDLDENDQVIEKTGRYVYYADNSNPCSYWVDPNTGIHRDAMPWKPSIHMPKEAARIWLKVTDVRVERLQDIDNEGVKAEGANWKNSKNVGFEEKMRRSAIERFAEIWDSTIKKPDLDKYGWKANPWVWVIEFERCERPEEEK